MPFSLKPSKGGMKISGFRFCRSTVKTNVPTSWQHVLYLVLEMPDKEVYEVCPALLSSHMHSGALICAADP